ncbi:hypothetical protein [Streptomyces sp. NBC_00102]|uniref:hypothetical protein n=1 Tax=Streptomyces sp. NBC_00102 TaxID=2975652 RepID=UPI00225ADADB|nr:hypothetical protein [Streptomyces sp. NBC_00102]MCX5402107.1 hypothetical protein [Streptomyces sp. NBC_00102]
MSAHSRIDNARGPVHSGSGDIHVHAAPDPREADGPSFRRIADDQLAWLRRVLVAPDGMGEARSRLARTGTVILDGAPGSGRTSAARVLLREYQRDAGVLHELLPGEDDELSLRDPDLVGTGDRLLLDLSAADSVRWAAAQADLPALRKTVHEQDAHLVVVMLHGGALDADLQHYRVEIGRPRGTRVLRRHLRTHGVPYEQYRRPDPSLASLLEQGTMREIADFADLVRRARETARPGDGYTQWCASARKAQADRRKEVAALFAQLREGSQRALLISVSMLHGAHADVIHRMTRLLLRTAGSPDDDLPLLQHKDLAERLAEVSAEAGPDGHVRFTELDHDTAVRTHVWDHLPDLRRHLGTWTALTVDAGDPLLTRELRDRLVAQLAGEYLRTGNRAGLASLAESWSSRGTSRAGQEAAVHALTCGLVAPGHGSAFRQKVYQWCVQKPPDAEFAQVLIRVCADVIAVSHPDQAMLRLYHLARREQGTGRAREALCDLVATSPRLRRRLLDRLARQRHTPAEMGIFLSVCDPGPLIGPYGHAHGLVEEPGTQDSLTTCWNAVLSGLPRETWQSSVVGWLHHAALLERRGDILLDLLVAAAGRCDGRGATFAALYASAREAERTSPAGPSRAAAASDRLLQKISIAQGIGPLTSPSP